MSRNLVALPRFTTQARGELRRAWLEPLLLVVLLAIWFGYGLGERSLWSPDEGRYAKIPRAMVASGDYVTPRLNGVKYFEKPPLVYWLTAGSIRAFGLNEWALRLWPAFFAALGCMVVYVVGRSLFGPTAGLIAAAVLATSPLYDLMGGALTLDMPLAGLLTTALGSFLLALREPRGTERRHWFYLFYVSVALAVLTKGLIGILIPALVIGAWVVLLGEWRLPREAHLSSGLAIVAAIAVPWHWLVIQANPEFAEFYFIHEHLARYLGTGHGRFQPGWFFIVVLAAGMFPWSAFLACVTPRAIARHWRERRQHREAWFLILWALVPLAFFSLSSSKLAPYILPVLAPLALLLGRHLARVWEERERLPGTILLALFALGVALCCVVAWSPELFAHRATFGSAATLLGWGLYAIAAALLAAGALPFFARLWGSPRQTIAVLIISASGISLALDHSLRRLDPLYSVKEVALALRSHLLPGDEVMTYESYYQDLPVYLERRITVVGWTGELKFGTTVEDTGEWIIGQRALRERWAQPRTIYLIANEAGSRTFVPPGPSCRFLSTARVVVSVNRDCPA